MTSKLIEKLKDPQYRKAFVASQISIGIPFQIRALRRARGWTQEKLAQQTGMLQPRISAIQSPGKAKLNIETLRRLAEAFDCGLVVRFAPFSELVRWSEHFEPDAFNVADFESDSGLIETFPPASSHVATPINENVTQVVVVDVEMNGSGIIHPKRRPGTVDRIENDQQVSGAEVIPINRGNSSFMENAYAARTA